MKLLFLQLGLLIWKCWRTESRRKIRMVCEIVFPLFMFLIVVAVRNSLSLRKSHFGAKPLLSAGVIPFIQGLLCHSNNTCQSSKTLGEDTRYPFNKTLVSLLQQNTKTSTETPPSSTSIPSSSDSEMLYSSLTAFWDAFCDEPFPIPIEMFNGNYTNGAPSPVSSAALGSQFKPRNCVRRYPSTTTTQRPPRFNNSRSTSSNSSITFTNPNILYSSMQLECQRFLCMLQSLVPLWVTLSRMLMGRIVYYPNTTIVTNLMRRVERGLNWPEVMSQAIFQANMYAPYFGGGEAFGAGARGGDRDSATTARIATLLRCLMMEDNRLEAVDSVERLIARAMRHAASNRLTAAVHFYDVDELQGKKLPNVVRYALRLDPSNLDKTTEVKDRPFNIRVRQNPLTDMPYFLTGFIYLQDVIDKTIIKMQAEQAVPQHHGNPSFAEVGTIMQQFPFPCYLDDVFLQVLANQLTMYIVLGWIFLAAIIVKSIVLEKERKLREVARIMGISPGLHFLSWFIFWSILMFVTALLFLLILKVGGVFVYASSGVIIVLMIVYSFATISFCFFVSSFFNRANVAAVVSGLVYFLTYIAFGGMTTANGDSLDLHKMVLSSILPNVALGYGWQVVANYEMSLEGASFANFNIPVSDEPSDQYTLSIAIATLLFDTIFYYFLAWYIDYVFPGEFGVPMPWYFVFQPSFWFGGCCIPYHLRCGSKGHKTDEIDKQPVATISGTKDFEPEPVHLQVGCAIKSIVKIYNYGIIKRIRMLLTRGQTSEQKSATFRAAVNHLSVNMYEGQITALLGHNGAGKTTTMSIMTGLIPATSGSVSIYGHDVASELSTVRRMMGFCPQFNVLYDELTVTEHLWFYSRMRGHENGKIRGAIEEMLKDTDLTLKRNEIAKVLSGGMRRRLSIAIAFIGDSKCVILDEPTAGVDPFARRQIWDLLGKFRAGRTIVLSTHHMDEAEILADRIAIVSHGRLQTCGSPLFLKQVHGEGYRLTIVKDARNYNETVPNGNGVAHGDESNVTQTVVTSSAVLSESDIKHEKTIAKFLSGHFSAADCRLVQHSGEEIQYQIGYNCVDQYARFFNSLDENLGRLAISTYGVSDTTLEEIFIKIAKETDELNDGHDENNKNGVVNGGMSLPVENGSSSSSRIDKPDLQTPPVKYETLTGFFLIAIQFYGLLVKRFHRMKRSWKGFIVELLLPVLFVLIGVAIIKLAEYKPGNPPRLELTPWLLAPGPTSARDRRLYTFFCNKENEDDMLHIGSFVEQASANSGYAGTRCMDPSANYSIPDFPCLSESHNESAWFTSEQYRQQNCVCSVEGVQQCSTSGSNNTMPKYRHLRTTDDVLNLTGFDVSSYIISRYKDLKHNLYGGWTFVIPGPMLGVVASNWLHNGMSSRTYNAYPKLFAPGSAAVWFNNKGWLSSVAYNNYVNNMLLRMTLSEDLDAPNSTYGIVTYNHPLNYTAQQFSEKLQSAAFVDVMLAIMLILALSFVPASFVMFLIEDRVSDSKHVQMVSGLRPAIYWLANYTWDCINYLIPVAACIIIFAAFNVEAYIDKRSVGALILLFIMYGFAIAPMLYPTSLYFTTPSTAFVILACVSLFIGAGTTIATWFLDLLYMREHDASLQNVNEILKVFFFIFPQYCFGRGLLNLAISYRTAQGQSFFMGSGAGMDNHKPFEWDVCGRFLVALFLHNIGWLVVNILLAYYLPYISNKFSEARAIVRRGASRCWRRKCACRVKNATATTAATNNNNNNSNNGHPPALQLQNTNDALRANMDSDDADVALEQQLILNNSYDPKVYSLIVKQLTKHFETSRGRLVAVDKLSFGVPTGQCFGLLGVNGAGKSTTFNMLTGLLSPSSGTATIQNYDILKSRNQANKLIGYCPQYDCITPLLSGRENLEFFARLRGVPERYVKQIADFNLRRMDLVRHADKPAGAYSGGNKRKLSVAIAISGEPQLILLDEPTAGIDPKARRHLWNAVASLLRNGQSVILTTHSMDECEALSTRLAIMVNGRFRCLGSPQHLKARFGEGYMLTLRFSLPILSLNNNSAPTYKDYQLLHNAALLELQRLFNDVALKESHDTVAVFALGASSRQPVKLGDLFAFLTNTEAMSSLRISDYSLMQSSLDAVFVAFAKMQRSERVERVEEEPVDANKSHSESEATASL